MSLIENPDYEIEKYWLDLKVYMSKFYVETALKPRNISNWSEILNKLQKEKNYSEIEYSIRNFLTCFLIDLIRYNKIYNGIIYSHYSNITNGYINKWNKLSDKFGFNSDENPFYNIVFCIFEIYYKILNSKCNTIDNSLAIQLIDNFNDIEIYLISKDFRWLIKFAIENKQSSILERLKECIEIIPIIESIYSISIPKTLSNANYKKIIDFIYHS